MEHTERKPDVTYYKSSSVSVVSNETADESKSVITTNEWLTATLSTSNTKVLPNDTVMFLICMQNHSDEIVRGVMVTEKLSDSYMTYVENSAIFHTDGEKPKNVESIKREGAVDFLLQQPIFPGRSVYLTFVAKVDCEVLPTTLYNYAIISCIENDMKTVTNSVRIDSEYADVLISKSESRRECGCDVSTFSIELKNIGNKECCDVVVRDVLPVLYDVQSVFCNQKELSSENFYSNIGNELIIKIPDNVKPHERAIITVKCVKRT